MDELNRKGLENEASQIETELQLIENEILKLENHNTDLKNDRIANKFGSFFLVFILLLFSFYLVPKIYMAVTARKKSEANSKEIKFQDSIKNIYASKYYWDSIENLKALQAKQDAIEKPIKQHCYNDKLSRLFDYEINSYSSPQNDNSIIILKIIEKETKNVIQSLDINTNTSIECSARSFVTGFNKNAEVGDGDYGLLIIQDFNFDGKEDIAVKTDFSQSGAIYSFYLKAEGSSYIPDRFLTDSIMYLPTIDLQAKTLNSVVRAGQDIYERKYSYDSISGWRAISHKVRQI